MRSLPEHPPAWAGPSEENLELLPEAGIHYIVGGPLRRAGEVGDVIRAWPGRSPEVAENLGVNGETYRLRSEASPGAVDISQQAPGYRIPPRLELLAKDDRDAKTGASRAQNALV